MKKLFVVLLLLLCPIAATACAQTNIEDLIALPETGSLEQRISDKLLEVEADDVSLVFALRGQTQNPISFFDINGDGSDEIVVLYRSFKAHPSSGDTANIHIFSENNGVLTSLFDIIGAGSGIDMIEFTDFNGDGIAELVVGYIAAYDSSTMLYVYEFDFVNKRADNTVARRYTEFVVTDLNGDGNSDMLSATYKSLDSVAYASFFNYDPFEKCVKESSITAPLSFSLDPYTMIPFMAENGKNAVILTSRYGTMLLTNEIIVWNSLKNQIENISYDQSAGRKQIAYMKTDYCSLGEFIPTDIDGDGTLEIPICRFFDEDAASQALTSWQEALLYPYTWYTFTGEELKPDFTSYINSERSYLFVLRDAEAYENIKAYLNYNNDLYFYYVAKESDTFPVFGVDQRILLFSVQSSSSAPQFDENHAFLYYSEVTGEYFTLVKADIPEEARQFMPSDDILTNAFRPATVTVGN
jgi:hypothetical protein